MKKAKIRLFGMTIAGTLLCVATVFASSEDLMLECVKNEGADRGVQFFVYRNSDSAGEVTYRGELYENTIVGLQLKSNMNCDLKPVLDESSAKIPRYLCAQDADRGDGSNDSVTVFQQGDSYSAEYRHFISEREEENKTLACVRADDHRNDGPGKDLEALLETLQPLFDSGLNKLDPKGQRLLNEKFEAVFNGTYKLKLVLSGRYETGDIFELLGFSFNDDFDVKYENGKTTVEFSDTLARGLLLSKMPEIDSVEIRKPKRKRY